MILVIYGAGGLAKEVYEMADRLAKWDKYVFVDDFDYDRKLYGYDVLSYSEIKNNYPIESVEFIVAVGEPEARSKIYDRVKKDGYSFTRIISDTAVISARCRIGEGCIIGDYSCIHADSYLGNNVLIQLYVCLGHDSNIGNHSIISTNASPGGKLQMGERAFVGMGAIIREKICIGDDAVISMGAVVYKDVNAGETVVGNPARVTIRNTEGNVFK